MFWVGYVWPMGVLYGHMGTTQPQTTKMHAYLLPVLCSGGLKGVVLPVRRRTRACARERVFGGYLPCPGSLWCCVVMLHAHTRDTRYPDDPAAGRLWDVGLELAIRIMNGGGGGGRYNMQPEFGVRSSLSEPPGYRLNKKKQAKGR